MNRMARPVLLLATTNPAKQARLAWLVRGLPLRLLTPAQAGVHVEIEEEGQTHRAIAEAKAIAWSSAVAGLALASDGGIDIPALGPRWEARLTRRAAGAAATDEQRARHLLALMVGLTGEQRAAQWREAVARADRGRLLGSWEAAGREPMRIAEQADFRGVPAGFWVPSVLEFPRLGRRYSELTPAERERALDYWTRLRRPVRAALRQQLKAQAQ